MIYHSRSKFVQQEQSEWQPSAKLAISEESPYESQNSNSINASQKGHRKVI
jgi:hypothetical protein